MMPCNARKFIRVIKFLLAGVMIFCVSWIASVNEWHSGVHWGGRREPAGYGVSTMRTIVAYSEGKQAEMDRPSPVTCDQIPAIPVIPHINRSWSPGPASDSSWQLVTGTSVSLYAAYYDDRTPQRYVRILASFHGRNFSTEEPLYCQTRVISSFENSVEVVAAKPLEIWWHEWDTNSLDVETPLLLSCPLTESLYSPSVVSIVTEPCNDPTNAFLLKPNKKHSRNKRNFTICVKDINFDQDISLNLIEWIETNKLLGVDIIDIYIDRINKETQKVLSYYKDKGYVRLYQVPIKNKSDRSLWQRRRDHIITYNDCLYRNIIESDFVIPLDIDEIILPKVADNLGTLIDRLSKRGWDPIQNSAILVQNVFFFGFMQGVDKYKKVYNTSKIYVKRDDVRISNKENLDISEIELIDDKNSLSNEVAEVIERGVKIKNEYKSWCGKEIPVPKLARHVVRSAIESPMGYYSKSIMLTRRVLTAFNHYPLASLGSSGFGGWSAPFSEVQLNHYKESCNTTVVVECARYGRRARVDRAALRLRRRLTAALVDAICAPINII
ncbi:uncharacterized protein LOC113520673 [Galleria mellonella]|uniref:Glycosyltransferase family 92 protein n=1 Tax=Galleria mellonella TaxID=7137 RepID=A0A6J1WYK9_GALME|nr:uncharacterized protein LOC113520673 [Galleria mellonella]